MFDRAVAARKHHVLEISAKISNKSPEVASSSRSNDLPASSAQALGLAKNSKKKAALGKGKQKANN